jgi:hypothetical protein
MPSLVPSVRSSFESLSCQPTILQFPNLGTFSSSSPSVQSKSSPGQFFEPTAYLSLSPYSILSFYPSTISSYGDPSSSKPILEPYFVDEISLKPSNRPVLQPSFISELSFKPSPARSFLSTQPSLYPSNEPDYVKTSSPVHLVSESPSLGFSLSPKPSIATENYPISAFPGDKTSGEVSADVSLQPVISDNYHLKTVDFTSEKMYITVISSLSCKIQLEVEQNARRFVNPFIELDFVSWKRATPVLYNVSMIAIWPHILYTFEATESEIYQTNLTYRVYDHLRNNSNVFIGKGSISLVSLLHKLGNTTTINMYIYSTKNEPSSTTPSMAPNSLSPIFSVPSSPSSQPSSPEIHHILSGQSSLNMMTLGISVVLVLILVSTIICIFYNFRLSFQKEEVLQVDKKSQPLMLFLDDLSPVYGSSKDDRCRFSPMGTSPHVLLRGSISIDVTSPSLLWTPIVYLSPYSPDIQPESSSSLSLNDDYFDHDYLKMLLENGIDESGV